MPDQSTPRTAAPTAVWRPMAEADLAAVLAVAAVVHPDFPEDACVFAERLRLWPAGCFVLAAADAPTPLAGYVVSHPWRAGSPPALNSLLGTLPDGADTVYLHDLALMPAARQNGTGAAMVDTLARHAGDAGFKTMSLVAVGNSAGFWGRQGFLAIDDPALAEKLASYGAAARFMVRML
ncbi:MAG: GNAT family N-acetyltransferase [Rhodoplanes sp.]|nr:GNAT family N-acetyltransferase [Rhodoplanes sp.]